MTERVFKRKQSQEENDPKTEAEKAVDLYEEERSRLGDMQASFKRDFPNAYPAYVEIMHQADKVHELVKEAHALVQSCKETVGDFKCVRKWKKAGYDPVVFVDALKNCDMGGEIIEEMNQQGMVEKIILSDRAPEFFVTHPDYARYFESAWREKTEATPAVTCPKPGVGF